MTRGWRFFCGMVLMAVMVAGGSALCYVGLLQTLRQEQRVASERLSDQIAVDVQKQVDEGVDEIRQEATRQAAAQEKYLAEDAIYQTVQYNLKDNTQAVDYGVLPQELVGKTRQDVEKYCEDYMQKMPVEEYLAGLQSMEVASFSSSHLTVKKEYDVQKVTYKYYLIADEGEVVVYYGDKKTVYERTGISYDSLPKAERNRLKQGVRVKNDKELFSILENYSS